MGQKLRYGMPTLICAGLLLGAAACGSSGSSPSTKSSTASTHGSAVGSSLRLKPGEDPTHQNLYGGKRGGTLTVYTSTDFEQLDPGEAYFTLDYGIMYATQRTLFRYPPNSSTTIVPDLATEVPTLANGGISDHGRRVTVHIEHGVHFSPPVNREVTSADIAYAIERAASPNVGSAYFVGYFGSGSPTPLVGADNPNYKGGPIPGIQTPNRYTIVFHMTKPGATFLVQALTMPITIPVPEEFAAPMDKHAPTTYGTQAEAFTGPYMLESNLKTGVFAGLGYQPGKSATLVRNPNWNHNTYTSLYRPPAYLNRININIGGNSTVIGQQVLDGSDSVQLDQPAHDVIEAAYNSHPSQITFTPGAAIYYVALDNAHGPFQNENLRKAVWAAVDRAAIARAVGGTLVAQPMTHFIYPGTNGFSQAGGYAGPQTDFNQSVSGNQAVATKYMKLAGYPSGKYTGGATLQVVGANSSDFPAYTAIVNNALTSLGFHTHVTQVDQSVMYAKYCGVPKQEIDVCPSVAWIRDFADPLTVLYETFYGPAIVPTNNANSGQVDNPQINAAIHQAALVVDPAARYQAWADVDKLLVDNAVAVPGYFSNQPQIESKDVRGVNNLWNQGTWDFAYSSLTTP
jgi:peptide/nickel transport system substrate-binding protein